jgi:hypothetical protein
MKDYRPRPDDDDETRDVFDRLAVAMITKCQQDGKRRCLGLLLKDDGTEEAMVMIEEEAIKTLAFKLVTTVTPDGDVIIAKDGKMS